MQNKKIYLDEKDKVILKEIVSNSRSSVATIAEKTGLQRDTVSYRLKNLRQSGLIMQFHTILDPFLLGFGYFANIFIKTEVLPKKVLEEFHMKLTNNPNITHATLMIGNVDIFITVVARDAEDFGRVVDEIKNHEPKVIANMNICTIVKDIKIDDFKKLIDII